MLAVKVVSKKIVADGVLAFDFEELSGKPLPEFSAGAHIDVLLPSGTIRQYSLCNAPGDRYRYEIGVLRDPHSRGGSIEMHNVSLGDVLKISEPRNLFGLVPNAGHYILVAGGIGITPLLSMKEVLTRTGSSFEMHCCARSLSRVPFRDRLGSPGEDSRIHVYVDDGEAQERFDARAALAGKARDTHIYVCGPQGFIDHVWEVADSLGYQPKQLHREFFKARVDEDADDRSFEIQVASTGDRFVVGKHESVVSVLAKRGFEISTSCEQGICGACVTGVLQGTPLHRDQFFTDDERRANDQFTPCCSRSLSPLLILDI